MSDQVSEATPQQQIANLQTELKETQIQLQKLRAAAWGAADIFRREAEEDCGNGRFIATPTMVEILWGELNGIPEDLDLLRWARENELADLRDENERLRAEVAEEKQCRQLQMAQIESLDGCIEKIRAFVEEVRISVRCWGGERSFFTAILNALESLDAQPSPMTKPSTVKGSSMNR
jgi:hypothetical protein